MSSVPPPAYPLGRFLKERGMPDTVVDALKAEPFKITTLRQLVYGFSGLADLRTRFCNSSNEPMKTIFENNQGLAADFMAAWDDAHKTSDADMQRKLQGLPAEDLESPLRLEEHQGLTKVFGAHSAFNVPGGLMGLGAFLGRLHRELKDRAKHTLYKVRLAKTQRMALEAGPANKRQKLPNTNVTLEQGDVQPPPAGVTTCVQYLFSLEVYCYTLAVAGAFEVHYKSENLHMIKWQDLLEHLANAKAFVVKHTSGQRPYPDSVVLAKLFTLDESIRGNWGELFRTNDPEDIPFCKCIQNTASLATGLWLQKPDRPAGPANPMDKGGKGKPRGSKSQRRALAKNAQSWMGKGWDTQQQTQQQQQQWEPRPPGKGTKNKGGKPGGKGTKGRVKTTNRDRWGTKICKPWNDGRGCQNGDQCPDSHCCDVLMASDQACGNTGHTRLQHMGPTIPL